MTKGKQVVYYGGMWELDEHGNRVRPVVVQLSEPVANQIAKLFEEDKQCPAKSRKKPSPKS